MSKQVSLKKTRVDFISDLLQSKKLGSGQKERVFGLVAKEIDFMESQGNFIISEIEAIKAKMGLAILEKEQAVELITDFVETEVIEKHPLPEYISPEGNARFLTELNQDPILKSITHNVDSDFLKSINDELNISDYDFKLHLAEIKNRYKKLSSKYFGKTSKGLTEKTYAYIFGNKPWSEDRIEMNWSNKALADWADANPGHCPNAAFDIGEHIFTFKKIKPAEHAHLKSLFDLVLFYKKQVNIRHDNNVQTLVSGWNIDFEEIVQFNSERIRINIDLFTDVEKLNQAYRRLIELCIECHPNKKLEIDLSFHLEEIDSKKYIIFSIWQKKAVFGKSVTQLLDRYGNTFTNLINHQLNGLCNWTLEADFGNNEYSWISLWPKTGEHRKINKMEGIRFNLIFNY